jgi:uncharacterized protein YjbJ (UPF0337 family)
MDWDVIKGNWKQLTGKIREQWGLLIDDDVQKVEGIIQERCGVSKERSASRSMIG